MFGILELMELMMKCFFIGAVALVFVFFAGCSETDGNNIADNIKISECGGFESSAVTKLPGDETEDCSQLIVWNYNDSTGVLNVMNEAVRLNCCGEHSVAIEEINNGYEFNIVDRSEHGARCDCTCSFDFGADITGIDGSSVKLAVYTDVEEEEEKTLQWEGTLDLTQKNGTIVVKERTGDHCY